MEEYGMEDEGKEWRKVRMEDIPRVREEWEAAKVAAAAALAKLQAEEAAAAEAERVEAERAEKAAKAAEKAAEKPEKKRKRKQEGVDEEHPPPPKTGKVTAAGRAPKPPPDVSGFRYTFGMEVEVMGHDQGFEGSWYAAEVINAKDYAQLLISYDSLFEEDNPTKQLTEHVTADQLRPKPPDPPANWQTTLVEGQPIEMIHDGGKWEVDFIQFEGQDQLLVYSKNWGTKHLVTLDNALPGWLWSPTTQKWTEKPAPSAKAAGRGRGRGGAGRGRGR
uniref:Agenet domain-containing protein n=1 Tax=Haptolina ericina TaxID=156174 RepID=A0A7S3C2C9_9EUKA